MGWSLAESDLAQWVYEDNKIGESADEQSSPVWFTCGRSWECFLGEGGHLLGLGLSQTRGSQCKKDGVVEPRGPDAPSRPRPPQALHLPLLG